MYLYDTISRQAIQVMQVDRGSGLVVLRTLDAHPGDDIRAPLGLLENALRTRHLVPLKEAYVALLGEKASMREASRLAFYEQLLTLGGQCSLDLTSSSKVHPRWRQSADAYLDAVHVLSRSHPPDLPSTFVPKNRGRRRA